MPKQTVTYPTIDPRAVITVEDALEALQKAFQRRDETPREEQAAVDSSEQPNAAEVAPEWQSP